MKMGGNMHGKSDSEVTSTDATSPQRSPRRPLYYVQSPAHSHHDVEKMSFGGSSPSGSPPHHYQYLQYHCSPVHHSRESSTSRFSASLKNPPTNTVGWKKFQRIHGDLDEEEEEEEERHGLRDDGSHLRFYLLCFASCFVLLFAIFSLILWATSLSYKPKISLKTIAFENFNVQAGLDSSGVATDMLTLNSTVTMLYRNPATFFGVHVTATPFQLYYYDLEVATGRMKEFYQSRKSQRKVLVVIQGKQVPLYGGLPLLNGARDQLDGVAVPLNLTFTIRSRAYILGRLVKSKFYKNIFCRITLRGIHLIKPKMIHLENCAYR